MKKNSKPAFAFMITFLPVSFIAYRYLSFAIFVPFMVVVIFVLGLFFFIVIDPEMLNIERLRKWQDDKGTQSYRKMLVYTRGMLKIMRLKHSILGNGDDVKKISDKLSLINNEINLVGKNNG